jgi:CheY-like chemotaxis protein
MSSVRPVMVVDDDEDTREVLEELLKAEGFSIITVSNGFEAIQKANATPEPCAIILDGRMPLMSGLEFISYREKNPRLSRIPVIFVSGDPEAIRAVSERGAITFRKPFPIAALIERVREHCA